MSQSTPAESDPYRLNELEARREKALGMGGPAKIERIRAAGKLTVRDRIDALLDPETFREVGLLTTSDLPDVRDKTAADGKVCGFGRIDGRTVYVSGDDVTVLAGSGGRVGVKKDHDAMTYAAHKGYACIALGDAGGARIPDIMPLKIMTFIEALHHSTVPRFSVVIRKSYGMAHCNMSGGNMKSDALYAWPTADVSFMAPDAAANVVFGRKVEDFDDPEGPRAALIDQMKRMNAPWDAAGLGLFTDVIDPRDTRRVLCEALERALGERGDRGRSQRLLSSWPRMT